MEEGHSERKLGRGTAPPGVAAASIAVAKNDVTAVVAAAAACVENDARNFSWCCC